MEEYESNANFTSLISNLTSEDRLLARVFIIHARFVLLQVLMRYLFIYLFLELKIPMNYYQLLYVYNI